MSESWTALRLRSADKGRRSAILGLNSITKWGKLDKGDGFACFQLIEEEFII
jgi:hypothetical protein